MARKPKVPKSRARSMSTAFDYLIAAILCHMCLPEICNLKRTAWGSCEACGVVFSQACMSFTCFDARGATGNRKGKIGLCVCKVEQKIKDRDSSLGNRVIEPAISNRPRERQLYSSDACLNLWCLVTLVRLYVIYHMSPRCETFQERSKKTGRTRAQRDL